MSDSGHKNNVKIKRLFQMRMVWELSTHKQSILKIVGRAGA